jgi:type IV pilus assembly protein PilE
MYEIADCGLKIKHEPGDSAPLLMRNPQCAIRNALVCDSHDGGPTSDYRQPITDYLVPITYFPRRRRGWSLVEVMVAMAVIAVLAAWAAPSFRRAVEQSRADIAVANLRAVWSAERLYWLDYRTYAADLAELQALGLLDPAIVTAAAPYAYAVESATSTTLRVNAVRSGSSVWSGQYSIDEDGSLTGVVSATGEADIVPGFN